MWPELLYSQQSSSAWFAAFCESPIVFHGFHYAIAVHADALRGQTLWSNRNEMIAHKNMTIRLLNNMLSHLDDHNVDIEIVIHAVLLLTHNDLRDNKVENSPQSALSPHFPYAGWLNVFGGIGAVQPHAQALQHLLERAGGLKALKFPGLASIIAL